MKKHLIITMLLAGLMLFVGCKKQADSGGTAGSESKAKTITLNYANFPPAPTFPCVQMERWKEEVEKRTDGQVKINTFPGGSLLQAKAMMDGVISGQADIGCLCMAYQPGRFVVTNATSLPMGIPTAKSGSHILWQLYETYQPDEFKDVKVLTMFTTAPSNIMSQKPYRQTSDLKGADIRGSGSATDILKIWGANPVGMPMSEVPEALQKGTITGLFSSLEAMKDFKYAELCKYVTMTETNLYPFAVVMNQAKWDALPADVQQVLEELALEQCLWTGEYMDNHVQESIRWSKETHGVEFIELSDEEKAQWNEPLAAMTEKWIADTAEKGLPAAEIIATINELLQAETAQP